MKNSRNRNILFLLIMIVSSVILEIAFSNFDYFFNGNKGITKLEYSEDVKKYNNVNVYTYSISDRNIYIDELEINYEGINLAEVNLCYYDDGKCYNIYDENLIFNLSRNTLSIDKKLSNFDLIIKTNGELKMDSIKVVNQFQFNLFRFILILLVFFFAIYFYNVFKEKKKVNYPILFLSLIITFGILFAIMNPIYFSPDEKEHFVRSYNVANGNLLFKSNSSVEWPKNTDKFLTVNYDCEKTHGYKDFITKFNLVSKSTFGSYEDVYYPSTAISYLFIPYTVSGLGVFFGKIFGASLLQMFYIGRIFNLLFYSLLGYFALKKLNGTNFQKILFILMLTPVCISQAASYSVDMFTNIFAFLALSYILAIMFKKEKMKKKELAVILMSCTLSTISKASYFPLFLLIFLIPKEKYENKNLVIPIRTFAITLSLSVFAICSMYASFLDLNQWHISGVDLKLQFMYIIKNPLTYLLTLFNTINENLFRYLATLTNIGYNGNMGYIYDLIILIILGFLASLKSDFNLEKKDKIILAFVIILTLGASMSCLYLTYTPVGRNVVDGFQGRYLIPVVFPIILLFNRKKGLIRNEDYVNKLVIGVVLLILAILLFTMITNYYY